MTAVPARCCCRGELDEVNNKVDEDQSAASSRTEELKTWECAPRLAGSTAGSPCLLPCRPHTVQNTLGATSACSLHTWWKHTQWCRPGLMQRTAGLACIASTGLASAGLTPGGLS